MIIKRVRKLERILFNKTPPFRVVIISIDEGKVYYDGKNIPIAEYEDIRKNCDIRLNTLSSRNGKEVVIIDDITY